MSIEKKSAWEKYDAKAMKKVMAYGDDYIDFLSTCKTERECVDYFIEQAEKNGYKEIVPGKIKKNSLKKGDKVYFCNMNKELILFNIGAENIEDGMNILGAHIDSPRLDVKSNPLFEEGQLAYLDTHYYGGIKKYQWVTIPLSLHGVICKKDGTTVIINIGEEADDPVFFISDLLIHAAQEQMEKKAAKVIEGENLDLIVGNMPLKKMKDSDKKNTVMANVLSILKENYDIDEEDFLSAELEVVPAGRARHAGFDKSMVLAYGHDDRVCAYSSFMGMLEAGNCKKTTCCILVDKEEIGSVGATGMRSMYFENCCRELLEGMGKYSELCIRRMLMNSFMLSSDVTSAFDPAFASQFEKKNTCLIGSGFSFNKYTGSRGKSGSNDANAEYLAKVRQIMDEANVSYQFSEICKVDNGGGGTIAYITALYGMNVVDCGVPVLNMHAPNECISKADLYENKLGYIAFLQNA